jgi:hypothetical protein
VGESKGTYLPLCIFFYKYQIQSVVNAGRYSPPLFATVGVTGTSESSQVNLDVKIAMGTRRAGLSFLTVRHSAVPLSLSVWPFATPRRVFRLRL